MNRRQDVPELLGIPTVGDVLLLCFLTAIEDQRRGHDVVGGPFFVDIRTPLHTFNTFKRSAAR